MTGIEQARETASKIKTEVEEEKMKKVPVKVESSKDIAPVKANLSITGLEEVPVSIIPLPFYKLVQPGSTNITLSDGTDAIPGTFFMSDSGKSETTIKFALLRAKRMHRNFTNNEGEQVHSTSMAILGINLGSMLPFMMNVSIASFANFGRMLGQMRERGITKAWQYPVTMTTEKREEVKDTVKGSQRVKYWVINFQVEKDELDEETVANFDKAYAEFAASLDRNNEEKVETEEGMPF